VATALNDFARADARRLEYGARAGPSRSEMQIFIAGPAGASLPKGIEHPVRLYEYFMEYQGPWSADGGT
jgi:hypothetical protein